MQTKDQKRASAIQRIESTITKLFKERERLSDKFNRTPEELNSLKVQIESKIRSHQTVIQNTRKKMSIDALTF